jgi:hypothetical protein
MEAVAIAHNEASCIQHVCRPEQALHERDMRITCLAHTLECSEAVHEHLLDERLCPPDKVLTDELCDTRAHQLELGREGEHRGEVGGKFVLANDLFEYGRHAWLFSL